MKRFNFTGTSKEKDILGSLNICSPQSLWIFEKKIVWNISNKGKKAKKRYRYLKAIYYLTHFC